MLQPTRFNPSLPPASAKRPIRTWSCILLALLLGFALSLGSGLSVPVLAESTSETLAAAKAEQEKLAAERERLERQASQLANQADKLTGELAWLNQRSADQRRLYEEKQAQLTAAVSQMEDAVSAHIEAEETLTAKQLQYTERLKVMIDFRQKSIFQIFLEADSLQGFFTTMQFMNTIAETDAQMIDELEAAKDDATLKRELADQYSREMGEIVRRVEADLLKIQADASARKEDLDQVDQKITGLEQAEDDLLAEFEQLAGQIYALQKQLEAEKAAAATRAAQATRAAEATRAASKKPTPTPKPSSSSSPSSSKPNSKGYVWPYPGDTRVYSPFGMRYHPIYHRNRMHTGVDLGGSYGSPVVAAKDGTVLMVVNPREGKNTGGSGYGNYIVIAHSNGVSTLYAHLRSTYVRAGETVKAGEKIAACGSTGTSTGAHLHFEVRVNGNPVNPMKYIG
ncbi:MAG: peptidoglycan DD-metalloendopeptidase family protein [Clostridiaceae bacterium]|nr:peptidoglycan DD-metalloendopeptidase family protein [Clostridiaceae bacterium]